MLVSQTYITTLGFVHRLQELNSDSQPLIHWSILPALKTGLEDFILKCVFLIFFIDNSFIVLSQYLDSCFIVFFFFTQQWGWHHYFLSCAFTVEKNYYYYLTVVSYWGIFLLFYFFLIALEWFLFPLWSIYYNNKVPTSSIDLKLALLLTSTSQ